MPQFLGLPLQGVDQTRMGMAQRVHGNAGAEIEIFLARFGFQPRAIAADEPQIGAPIGGHYMRRVFARTHSTFTVFSEFHILAAPQATKKANEKTAPKGGLINFYIKSRYAGK